MNAVLDAPRVMRGREQVSEFLSALPENLQGCSVEIRFEPRALGTPSFLDELVRVVLADRSAVSLTLEGMSEQLCVIATDAADYFRVSDKLVCVS